ncbi:hypothetical protein ETAA8_11520 [Anatilimnocola aggregata]|uniref:Uncharacterized protein n=1 Tax=Anatilimnocola aggregata TaxID=2528021 RepID=A0A517Y762_9BACT|nr:hypothetical protein [Anatilimnocola aggregata]QDU26078.1 hypothetical protein ETAA8_11520 [Anatilimnocola aggregata]
MARNRLRIYYGPEETQLAIATETLPAPRHSVSVPLDEVLPLLVDAVRSNRTWVDDFGDEEITISNDLYEVLLAYQHFRRPSA